MSSKTKIFAVISIVVIAKGFQGVSSVSWDEWWTYDGISGPSFWGLINPDWHLCNQGRRQSPIDLQPEKMLYDPVMEDLKIIDDKVSGTLENSGHSVLFRPASGNFFPVNVSGGPLAYNYPVQSVNLHFGMDDETGSEHLVAGSSFVGEVQLLGFNADLYQNFSLASQEPHGLVGVAVLMEIGELSNQAVRRITNHLEHIQYEGQSVTLSEMSLLGFLPEGASGFMSYQGSMTEPGCQETVEWVIMNRPIYITQEQLLNLRKLVQGDKSEQRAPLGGNFRPTQSLNGRTIRTNVAISANQESKCPTLQAKMEYQATARPRPTSYRGMNTRSTNFGT